MESIKELYKIVRGPSSSHTIGPERACIVFKEKNKYATDFKVILYGSLAKTGKGHGTDAVIKKTLVIEMISKYLEIADSYVFGACIVLHSIIIPHRR